MIGYALGIKAVYHEIVLLKEIHLDLQTVWGINDIKVSPKGPQPYTTNLYPYTIWICSESNSLGSRVDLYDSYYFVALWYKSLSSDT